MEASPALEYHLPTAKSLIKPNLFLCCIPIALGSVYPRHHQRHKVPPLIYNYYPTLLHVFALAFLKPTSIALSNIGYGKICCRSRFDHGRVSRPWKNSTPVCT
jgi:hypothetical protein